MIVTNDPEIELMKIKHAGAMENWKADQEMRRLLSKGALDFGAAALKSAILINGGAAAALLAVVSHAGPGSATATALLPALMAFVAGVLAGAVATGAAYVSQLLYASAVGGARPWAGVAGNVVSAALVATCYGTFAVGAWIAAVGMGW